MINKIINWIKTVLMNYFNLEIKVDSKSVKRSMYIYFEDNEWHYKTTITRIEVYKKKDSLRIVIETHMPGMLLGKGGRFIDGLIAFLKEDLKCENINTNINECTMWHNIWRD